MADNGEHARAQSPLLGVVLCCTSILPEERSEIAAIASQMGAIHKLDLTSDVTHLLVGGTDTPKYKFVAKERPDVKCLLPTWIEAVRKSWLEGGETEVEALEIKYQLPTFTDLRICVTGFDDLAYRKELEVLINANGGEYRGNLTKDVTHLVAKVPTGNKYVYAGHWGVKIVAIEWLEQSLERGMILDEDLYNLLLPEDERGRSAWIRRSGSTSSLGKRARDAEVATSNPRQLRRTASAKLSNQSVGLWTDIVGGEVRVKQSKSSEWDDKQNDSVDDAVDVKAEVQGKARPRPSNGSVAEVDAKPLLPKEFLKGGLFSDKLFLVHGFGEKKTSILQEYLLSHGANIATDVAHLSELPGRGYLLVPHTSSTEDIPLIPDSAAKPTVVTDMWVERCLFRKEFVQPQANVTNIPFPRFPIPGFEKLTVCSTAFQGMDLLHMSKAVKLMGANYDEFFTPDATVLLCKVTLAGREKLRHALHWNVPAVTADWLWDSIRIGQLKPFDPYLVQPYPPDPPPEESDVSEKTVDNRIGKSSEKPAGHGKLVSKVVKTEPHAKEKLGDAFSTDAPAKQRTSSFTNHDKTETPNDDSNDTPQTLDISLDDSSHTLRGPSLPLQEISLNPSPSPTKSPPKPPPASPLKVLPLSPSRRDSLGPTISSLLAAHKQRSRSATTAPTAIDTLPRMGRRRRQLLGRATSNLSNHSAGSAGAALSRASSVDTVNTDGLGTPLEPSHPNGRKPSIEHSFKALHYAELGSPLDGEAEAADLQSTQLGYEDPDVKIWRDRVMRKMGGGGVDVGMEEKDQERGVRRIGGSVRGNEGRGIAGRTRQSVRGG